MEVSREAVREAYIWTNMDLHWGKEHIQFNVLSSLFQLNNFTNNDMKITTSDTTSGKYLK